MNKAHTATAKRIAKRYGLVFTRAADDAEADVTGVDPHGRPMVVEIETSATLGDAVARLTKHTGLVYVAVTNKEALIDAVRLTKDTPIGVMDPRGDVVKECAALAFPPSVSTVQNAWAAEEAQCAARLTGQATNGLRANETQRVVSRPEARGYTKEPAHSPTYDASFEPIYVAPSAEAATGPTGASTRRAFAFPDAEALSQPLPVGFGSDGPRLAAG